MSKKEPLTKVKRKALLDVSLFVALVVFFSFIFISINFGKWLFHVTSSGALAQVDNVLAGFIAAIPFIFFTLFRRRKELLESNRQLQQSEMELQRATSLLESLQQQSPDGMLLVDEAGEIITFNKTFAKIWAIPSEIMNTRSDRKAREYVLGQLIDPAGFLKRIDELYANKEAAALDLIELKGGRTFERYSSPLFSETGDYIGRVWYFSDITHRENMYRKIAKRESILKAISYASEQFVLGEWNTRIVDVMERLAKAIDVTQVLVFENGVDANNAPEASIRFHWTSPAASIPEHSPEVHELSFSGEEFTRWHSALAKNNLISGHVHELPTRERAKLAPYGLRSIFVVPIVSGHTLWGFIGFFESRELRDWAASEMESLTAAAGIIGSAIWRSMMMNELLQHQLTLESYVKERTAKLRETNEQLSKEITERKAIEEDLISAKDEAMRASQAKSQFLANMSHEMRTPLNGVIGMIELAMETDLNDEQSLYVNTINTEASALLTLIDEVLDLSKIESGVVTLEQTPFFLNYLLSQLTPSFEFKAVRQGIDFTWSLDPKCPPRLIGDPGRLRQVLVNLLGNSFKFTEQGHVSLSIQLLQRDEADCSLRFEVDDTGIGIPSDKIDAIFESFTQADDSITKQYGGTGLGTTISKMFVEQMGGSIGVKSSPGKGSMFWFEISFPICSRSASLDFQHEHLAANILIVDSNPKSATRLADTMKKWDYDAEFAPNARECLRMVSEKREAGAPYHLLIIDSTLPDKDGFELTKEIRNQPSSPPVLIMSSHGSRGDAARSRDAGAEGYMAMPVEPQDLQKCITTLLQGAPLIDCGQPLLTKHYIKEKLQTKYHILVAEDYPTNQKIMHKMLENAGYRATLAGNGQQALEHVTEQPFDMIFMDIQMPHMDGIEATRRIRRREREQGLAETPIIGLTAHAVQGYRQQCIEAGMDDFLTKPVRKKELLQTLRVWLNSHGERRRAQSGAAHATHGEAAAPQPQSIAPMDYERALAEFSGEKDFLNQMLSDYIDQVHSSIQEIQDDIRAENRDGASGKAHAIKGGAANLAAEPLASAAATLEEIALTETRQEQEDALALLKSTFVTFQAFVQEMKK